MEVVPQTVGPVLEYGLPYVFKKWEDHSDMKKNMEALKQALEKLNCQKVDLKRKLETMVYPGKIEAAEKVKLWLKNVAKINKEIKEMLDQETNVKFFSRGGLGRQSVKKKLDVDKLCEEGDRFEEYGLVRELSQRGIERPTIVILKGEATTENTRDEIMSYLSRERVTRIGLCGMGGIGKSTILEHVHNRLLKHGNKFDKVIMITASEDSNVVDLQGKIASEIGMEFPKDADEKRRAMLLYKEFSNAKKKRFVLIIDDLWEHYPLEKVGVPDPSPINGCKLIVATRSSDVCSKMNCEPTILMEFLPEHEALNLFMEKVGRRVTSVPALKKMVVQAAKECAGLPLAIVTVASALRDKTELAEWRVLLAKLKDATASISSDITATLRFSYDLLKDDQKLKECLLYCGMYPEDHLIEINPLIDQLIVVRIVREARTWQFQMDDCNDMLNQLVRNCLLIETVNSNGERCVKLHDSIRDMAIQIMRKSRRFLVETGEGSDSLKPAKEWNKRLEMVSFMGNENASKLRRAYTQNYPKLSTLLYSEIPVLQNLPEEFFKHMKGLQVLDISQTSFSRLPSSTSSLSNLAVLLLRGCTFCHDIPDLSELRNLVRLDLGGMNIRRVPRGVEKMAKLRYLNLIDTQIRIYRKGLWCGLFELRYLSIMFLEDRSLGNAEELASLRNLETLKVSFFTKKEHYKRQDFNKYMKDRGPLIILPKSLVNLIIEHYPGYHLCTLMSFKNTTNLQRLHVSRSMLEYLFKDLSSVSRMLQNIKELELRSLIELQGIGPRGQLPLGAFSSLKKLTMESLSLSDKPLFSLTKDASFPYLEEIRISYCDGMMNMMENGNKANIFTLPSLKILMLEHLLDLKSLPFVAHSLSTVMIRHCPKLKKVVFLQRKRRAFSLRIVEIDAEPWKSLAKKIMVR